MWFALANKHEQYFVTSKWQFRNQSVTWSSSALVRQCELTLRGVSISVVPKWWAVTRCYGEIGSRKVRCCFHGLQKPNVFLPVQVLSFIKLVTVFFYLLSFLYTYYSLFPSSSMSYKALLNVFFTWSNKQVSHYSRIMTETSLLGLCSPFLF